MSNASALEQIDGYMGKHICDELTTETCETCNTKIPGHEWIIMDDWGFVVSCSKVAKVK